MSGKISVSNNTVVATDDISIKLHIDKKDSNVWLSDGRQPPMNTGHSVVSFMLQPFLRKASIVQLLGDAINAHLIAALYVCVLKNQQLTRVEVCGPSALTNLTKAERADPAAVLLAIRNYTAPGSIGGWHEVKLSDYYTYALISQLQKAGKVNDNAKRLLRSHPVWKSLSFIPTLNQDKVCQLIAEIIDPRWYIDPKHPNRTARLNSYLGLKPGRRKGIYARRYELVQSCWYGEKPGKQEMKAPGNFLWRAKLLCKNTELADLRSNQLFVAYLRHTWLAGLYEKAQQEPLFVADHFFSRPVESTAYRDHVRTIVAEEK